MQMATAMRSSSVYCFQTPIPPILCYLRAAYRSQWWWRRGGFKMKMEKRSFCRASGEGVEKLEIEKPQICTADELHYVTVQGSNWRLALWRYNPPPEAPARNHPLLLLSGVATNATGFDLAPGASLARHMSNEGFDTWILEVRGAGLSKRKGEATVNESCSKNDVPVKLMETLIGDNSNDSLVKSDQNLMEIDFLVESENIRAKEDTTETTWEKSELTARLLETLLRLSEKLTFLLNESQYKAMSARLVDQISKLLEDAQLSERFNEIKGKLLSLLEERQNSTITAQFVEMSERLVKMLEDGQRSVPSQIFDLRERLISTIDDFQKQVDLIVKYDWDFDNYLEDIPAVMEYIQNQSKPKDGKLFAIGHSMGGILLYAHLSSSARTGKQSGLAAVVTLGSSLDYTVSNSSLKLLVPLADPAQALNVPVLPLGALMTAIYPLASQPPYALAWLNPQVSARNMMHPELLKKLVLNNFCTVPAKLILQLATAFRPGGLRNRTGSIYYKDDLGKCETPVLVVAGDEDLICPPEAVLDTAKNIPSHLVTYKLFGGENDIHYGHYDLVGGRLAAHDVYPCIIQFLSCHDKLETSN